jgi:hypothetical protein
MTTTSCPSCGVTLSIDVERRSKRADSPRPDAELAALRAFVSGLSGEYQTTDLHARYTAWAVAHQEPVLGQRNFGMGLQQIGVERRRTTSRRFWVL